MKYILQFKHQTDDVRSKEIIEGESIPIPHVGDIVSITLGDTLGNYRVNKRTFSYHTMANANDSFCTVELKVGGPLEG